MAVNENLANDYSTTAASNTPAGSDAVGTDLDDQLRDIKKNVRYGSMWRVQSKTGSYTATISDHASVLYVAASAATAATITLPAAATAGDGFRLGVKLASGLAANIDANGTETIDGTLTASVSVVNKGLMLTCDGSNWHTLAYVYGTPEGGRIDFEVDAAVQTKTTDYTQVATDVNNMIRWTSAGDYDLLAAATAGNDFKVYLMADGAAITIDPNGAETVNGAATVTVNNGESGTLFCDGSAWYFLKGSSGGGNFKGENGETQAANSGDIFRVHEQELNTNTTIDADENALCAGPLTVASGITLTVTSGGNLVIV